MMILATCDREGCSESVDLRGVGSTDQQLRAIGWAVRQHRHLCPGCKSVTAPKIPASKRGPR